MMLVGLGEVWAVIDDEIERRCEVEDAKQRRAAKQMQLRPVA